MIPLHESTTRILVLAGALLVFGCASEQTAPDDEAEAAATGSPASTGAGGKGGAATVGSGGAGATGGAAGNGGAGGTGGGAGPGGAGGGSTACTWAAQNPCGPNMFCDAPGCGAGTCKPVPIVELPDKSAQCGCDDVNYWNASVAASHSMAIKSAGECKSPTTCGGFGGIQCPGGLYCSYGGPDDSVCFIADGGGICWGVPAVCPQVVIGPITHACGAQPCAEECSLIKQQVAFYTDNTCPQ